MDKINKLISRLADEEKERVLLSTISLTEYPTLLALSEINKSFFSEISKKEEEELDNKFSECLSLIKEMNKIAEITIGEKIYEGSYERKDIETFMLELLDDVFVGRGIRRR